MCESQKNILFFCFLLTGIKYIQVAQWYDYQNNEVHTFKKNRCFSLKPGMPLAVARGREDVDIF